MGQEVKILQLADLVLWTENPRDPIDAKAADQDIVDRALQDERSKWNLPKLAKEMGGHYDYSELPTVVLHGNKPVVYDGNRRVILGKIKHGLVSVGETDLSSIPNFPSAIPCNVCSKEIALKNVYRKHADTGSWLPLERDIFLHRHMRQEKTPFLLMEENTGIISANPHLNQRFVKEEIFREDILNKLGISLAGDRILSKHSTEETQSILEDISRKVRNKEISTRNNRGKVLEVLDPSSQQIVEEHKKHQSREVNLNAKDTPVNSTTAQRQSRRVKTKTAELFGGPLYLRIGSVSNLYRDICDLHAFYSDRKDCLSNSFPALTRMALRLLCEAAAKDCGQELAKYIHSRFGNAKSTLDQDTRTTLSNHNVAESSIVQLLHTGAHNYTASSNMEQTLAVSIIIGAILTISHGKAAAA